MLFSLLERLIGLMTPSPFWIQDLGQRGEFLARRWYRRRGYHVVAANHRMGRGEIDLIVANGKDLVFVEVKSRTAGEDLTIDDVLTRDQEQRLLQLAEQFVASWSQREFSWRFELIYFRFQAGRVREVRVADLC